MSKIKLCLDFLRTRIFLTIWISLVLYIFCENFIHYKESRQFDHLRNILGLGLCVSRATAVVLNVSCALVLLPLCKKANQLLYLVMSKLCPRLFFYWLEKAKSFHMTVAATLLIFSVIHSMSHFVNIWNFSRNYDEKWKEVNFAHYKNENPIMMILTQPGITGVSMLLITFAMGVTSARFVRRKCYNTFWYTHRLYLPFIILLLIHPLSGVLKEQVVLEEYETVLGTNGTNEQVSTIKFISIKSKTWNYMAFPLICFFVDMLWRLFSRNRSRVKVLEVHHMAGGTMKLTLESLEPFICRSGQYVLLQCSEISIIEWHPFTVAEVPRSSLDKFSVWIRVKGDWTRALEKILKERKLVGSFNTLNLLVDGPFSSAMEGVCKSNVAMCVAAGVGITPFVSILRNILEYPRSKYPRRMHLIWVVRHEHEISWLADLANETLLRLRDANRPDRLQIEIYVTSYHGHKTKNDNKLINQRIPVVLESRYNFITSNMRIVTEKGISNIVRENQNGYEENTTTFLEEKANLVTPVLAIKKLRNIKREESDKDNFVDKEYELARKYPILGCRLRRGRPHWDRVFGYWVHLYPREQLNLYCCGPKQLIRQLRSKSKGITQATNTTITFVHEGFS